MGIPYHQFRLVDRHRSCRNPYLSYPVASQPEMENFDQSIRRGDDVVRRRLCGPIPGISHWPPLACLLAVPISERNGNMAAVSFAADVGRICGVDLRYGFIIVLVHRTYPGFCNTPR